MKRTNTKRYHNYRDNRGKFSRDMRFYQRFIVFSFSLMIVGMVYEIIPKDVFAETPEQTNAVVEVQVESPRVDAIDIEDLIYEKAAKYGTYGDRMYNVVKCETKGTFRTDIQSGYHYKRDIPSQGIKKGDREQSFGIAQIHIPAGHKTVDGRTFTEELAKDPDLALEFMAQEFSRVGGAKQWSCYNLIYGKK